jgi:hypothetical protein
MRFAYLSLDVVNQELASRLAARAGVRLNTLTFRDPVPNGPHDVVLYDLDFLPDNYRERLLDNLTSGAQSGRIAVHGYGLSLRIARALRRHGVFVARRLRGNLFQRLHDRSKMVFPAASGQGSR